MGPTANSGLGKAVPYTSNNFLNIFYGLHTRIKSKTMTVNFITQEFARHFKTKIKKNNKKIAKM